MIRKLLLALLFPLSAFADPALNLVTEEEFKNISKEMAANFMHHSVQGAAPLGDIFGFEVGIVGGQAPASALDAAVTRSGGSGVSKLYHAGLLGVVSVPFGITGEVMVIPKMSASGADFQMTSLGLKLSLNSLLPSVLPVNLAVRGTHSTAKFSFNQTSGGVTGVVENETKVTGVQLLVAPSLPIVEPYAGIGMLSGKNTLSSTGSSPFAPSYSTSNTQEHTMSSTQIILGVTANLLVFHVGAEYSNAFGQSTYTGKLGFGF